jgi:hypothetical protein
MMIVEVTHYAAIDCLIHLSVMPGEAAVAKQLIVC